MDEVEAKGLIHLIDEVGSNCPNLQTLICKGFTSTHIEMKVLIDSISKAKNLQKLHLSLTEITPNVLNHLGDALQKLPFLQQLMFEIRKDVKVSNQLLAIKQI